MKGQWTHFEPKPDETFAAALVSCRLQVWKEIPPTNAIRQLRMLGIGTCAFATLTPDQIPSPLGLFKASNFGSDDSVWIASTLMRTFCILSAELTPLNLDATYETHEAADPTSTPNKPESAGLPAVAIVALAVVGAALLGFVAMQASEVIDRHLARGSLQSEMLAAHEAALQMVGSHRDAEIKTGKSIPFTSAELEQIQILQERQRSAYKALSGVSSPLPSPFEGATERLKNFPWLIALLLVVFFASRR